MSSLHARADALQRKIDDTDINTLMEEYGAPVAHIMLPKQKALKRITRDILNTGSIFFKNVSNRVDDTYAIDVNNGNLLRVSVEHTSDAIELIADNSGFLLAREGHDEVIPAIAVVGYDGFASIRMERKDRDLETPVSIFGKLQTTKAGLVFAAKNEDALANFEQESRIAVAKTYKPLYEQFLDQAFPGHSIEVLGFKGGGESKPAFVPGVNVIGDLTDSGGSLRECGFTHVIDVGDSAPVLVSHSDIRERISDSQYEELKHLIGTLKAASKAAFPNEEVFETAYAKSQSLQHAVDVGQHQGHDVESLDGYLDRRGKSGRYQEVAKAASGRFYGVAPQMRV